MNLNTVFSVVALVLCVTFVVPAASAKKCKPGDKAKVKWKSHRYAATLKSKQSAKFCVHYDGWARSWDECVSASRFRCMGRSAFKKGEKVQVNWKGKYWRAKIKSIKGSRYCIGYAGYASSWDECVGPKRIRQ